MKTKLILEDHIIYGSWDGETGTQVLVHYHPNGLSCAVFLMSGCDYGGGILSFQEGVSPKVIQDLDDNSANDYEFYEGVRKLSLTRRCT